MVYHKHFRFVGTTTSPFAISKFSHLSVATGTSNAWKSNFHALPQIVTVVWWLHTSLHCKPPTHFLVYVLASKSVDYIYLSFMFKVHMSILFVIKTELQSSYIWGIQFHSHSLTHSRWKKYSELNKCYVRTYF